MNCWIYFTILAKNIQEKVKSLTEKLVDIFLQIKYNKNEKLWHKKGKEEWQGTEEILEEFVQ